MEQTCGAAQTADATRLAGRHLAQERMVNRFAPPGHASYFDHRRLAAGTHVAGEFAEGAFLFAVAGADKSFEHDLGIGRNFQVDSFTAHQGNGFAAQTARDGEFIRAVRELCDRREHDRRIDADRDCYGHVFFSRVVLPDMARRVLRAADVKTETLRPFHLQAVSADVAPAGFGILGDDERRGDVRSGILAGRPNHLWQDADIDFTPRDMTSLHTPLDTEIGSIGWRCARSQTVGMSFTVVDKA